MEKHFNILAALDIAVGVAGLIGAAFVFIFVAGPGLLLYREPGAMLLMSGLGTMLAGFITVMSLPSVVAGIALLQRRPWAPVIATLVAALNLINIPFGTPVGIYGLWIFLRHESTREFAWSFRFLISDFSLIQRSRGHETLARRGAAVVGPGCR